MKLIPFDMFLHPVNKNMNISRADEYENVTSSLIEFKELETNSDHRVIRNFFSINFFLDSFDHFIRGV